MSILENLHRFLVPKSHENTLQEKTKSAIILLQTLPCARGAVLDQIGEVFHEAAKNYITEVETQMLSGQHGVIETRTPEVDLLIKEIQKTLSGFIEFNHDAWAPQIARWSINLVGEICSQYGILRAFSNMQIDERLQLWMNCPACRILIKISVACFGYIIDDSPDVCVDYLLDTATKSSPYFDWAIVHISCCFLDVIPYGILSHALVAFSMQAKNAEVVINCVTRVYDFLLNQHGKVLQNAVLDLFKDSVSAESVEAGSNQEHIDKCTLPFLLHLALQAPRLVDQISEKVTDLLDMKTIIALNEQSSKRDVVLQRGLLSRVLDILKNVGNSTFKIVMFLINNSCFNDENVAQEQLKYCNERKRICGTLLEMLLLQLHDNVQNSLAKRKADKEDLTEDSVLESPFLMGLEKHLKNLCHELLQADSNLKAKLIIRVLSLLTLYGGLAISSDVFSILLINAKTTQNLSHFLALQCELEMYNERILGQSLSKFADTLCGPASSLPKHHIEIALNSCIRIINQESYKLEPERMKLKDCLTTEWTKFTSLTYFESYPVLKQSIILLDLLPLPPHSSLSDIFQSCRNLTTAYFKLLHMISKQPEYDDLFDTFAKCEELLLKVVKQNSIVQNTAIRLIIDDLFEAENISLITANTIAFDDDDETLHSEPKIQLLERNNAPDVVSRIPVNKSSIVYIGSLNRNKRKVKDGSEFDAMITAGSIRQRVLDTLDSMLTIKYTIADKINNETSMETNHQHVTCSFYDAWLSKMQNDSCKSSYIFTASLLSEIVCPDVSPTIAWPDEELLKYTVERDIKIKNQFATNPFLWDLISMISIERPALCYCNVVVQSLFATCLTYWETDRKSTVKASAQQLECTRKVLLLMKQAGWIPDPWSNAALIIDLIKPDELYLLLSGIWRFCKDLNITSQTYSGSKPSISFSSDQHDTLGRLFRNLFIRNMSTLGVFYKQFFYPNQM